MLPESFEGTNLLQSNTGTSDHHQTSGGCLKTLVLASASLAEWASLKHLLPPHGHLPQDVPNGISIGAHVRRFGNAQLTARTKNRWSALPPNKHHHMAH